MNKCLIGLYWSDEIVIDIYFLFNTFLSFP